MYNFRTDRTNLKIIETGEGFLKAKITIARPGVFQYMNTDGSVSYEAKLPGDILSAHTVNSAKGVPITDDHPKINGEHIIVDSENYNQFVRGNVSEPKIEDGQIVALATIYDSELIKRIKSKEQIQSSIGFTFETDKNPGIFEGQNFDFAQKNITINHVALVKNGRAGDKVKIHIDKKDGKNMKWIVDGSDASNLLTYRRFDETDIQVDSEIHGELMSARNQTKEVQKNFDALEKENKILKEQNEKLKADAGDIPDKEKLVDQLEVANDKAEALQKKYDELEASIPDMVDNNTRERLQLVEFAKSVDPELKTDSLSNKEIKLQVIAKGLPFKAGVKMDSVSDDAIEARFDAACELLRERATDTNTGTASTGFDRNSVDEKKNALQNVYQREQKKNDGGE